MKNQIWNFDLIGRNNESLHRSKVTHEGLLNKLASLKKKPGEVSITIFKYFMSFKF